MLIAFEGRDKFLGVVLLYFDIFQLKQQLRSLNLVKRNVIKVQTTFPIQSYLHVVHYPFLMFLNWSRCQ